MIRSWVRFLVAFVYLSTNVIFLNAAETAFWAAHGSARTQDAFAPSLPSHPSILLIQDVHMNSEAQRNIATVLASLSPSTVVGVEGVSGKFDFARFHAFKNARLRQSVANVLLDDATIAAPSYAGITRDEIPTGFVGVDDREHYDLNVEAYRKASAQTKERKRELSAQRARLQSRKSQFFGARLARFDALRESYRAGRISIVSYLDSLVALTGQQPGPELNPFIRAARIEALFDFEAVEKQRRQSLAALAPLLDKNEAEALVSASRAFQSGRNTSGAYYAQLTALFQKHHVTLASYPSFNNYLGYVAITDRLNSSQLFTTLEQYEAGIVNQLVHTRSERMLLEASDQLHLTGRLLDFALTPSEWKKYQSLVNDRRPSSKDLSLSNFESFYREADIRSARMVDNLLRAMGNSHFGVMVAGGFHTEEIKRELAKRGCGVTVLQPTLTKVPSGSGSAYLSVFTREKSPIEKILQGQKLFLASNTTAVGNPVKASLRAKMIAFGALSLLSSPNAKASMLVTDPATGARIQVSQGAGGAETKNFAEGPISFDKPVEPKDGSNITILGSFVFTVIFTALALVPISLFIEPFSIWFYVVAFIPATLGLQTIVLGVLWVARKLELLPRGENGEFRMIRFLNWKQAKKISWLESVFKENLSDYSATKYPHLRALVDPADPKSLYSKIPLVQTVILSELDSQLPHTKVIIINEKNADPFTQAVSISHETFHKIFMLSNGKSWRVLRIAAISFNELFAFFCAALTLIPITIGVMALHPILARDRFAPDLQYLLTQYENSSTKAKYSKSDIAFLLTNPKVVHAYLPYEVNDPQAGQIVSLMDLTAVDPVDGRRHTVRDLIKQGKWSLALNAIVHTIPPVSGMTTQMFLKWVVYHAENRNAHGIGSVPETIGEIKPLAADDKRLIDLTTLSQTERAEGEHFATEAKKDGKVALGSSNAGEGRRITDNAMYVPPMMTKAFLPMFAVKIGKSVVFSTLAVLNLFNWSFSGPSTRAAPFSFFVSKDNRAAVEEMVGLDPLVAQYRTDPRLDYSFDAATSAIPLLNPKGGVLWQGENLRVRPMGLLGCIFTWVVNGHYSDLLKKNVKWQIIRAGENASVLNGNVLKNLRDVLKNPEGPSLAFLLVEGKGVYTFKIKNQGELIVRVIGNGKLDFSSEPGPVSGPDSMRPILMRHYEYSDIDGALKTGNRNWFVNLSGRDENQILDKHLPEGVRVRTHGNKVEFHRDSQVRAQPVLEKENRITQQWETINWDNFKVESVDSEDRLLVSDENPDRIPMPALEQRSALGWEKIPNEDITLEDLWMETGGLPVTEDGALGIRDNHELIPIIRKRVEAEMGKGADPVEIERRVKVEFFRMRLVNFYFNSNEVYVVIEELLADLGFSDIAKFHDMKPEQRLEILWAAFSQVVPGKDDYKENGQVVGHQLTWTLASVLRKTKIRSGFELTDRYGKKNPNAYTALKESRDIDTYFNIIKKQMHGLIESGVIDDIENLNDLIKPADFSLIIHFAMSLVKGKSFWPQAATSPSPAEHGLVYTLSRDALEVASLLADESPEFCESPLGKLLLDTQGGAFLFNYAVLMLVGLYLRGYGISVDRFASALIDPDFVDVPLRELNLGVAAAPFSGVGVNGNSVLLGPSVKSKSDRRDELEKTRESRHAALLAA